jgi:hypothetical protein
MMKIYSEEEKERAQRALPPALRVFLNSEGLKKAYLEIQNKEKLNLRQLGTVIDAATLVLLGLEPESSFEENLANELPELQPANKTSLIATVNETVFKAARESLKAGS